MNAFSQEKNHDRKPYAAGKFYSSDAETLKKDISALFSHCKKVEYQGDVRAIIVPHAGYIFSGETAATAFSATPRKGRYKNIFIIGSSHVAYFDGASIYYTGDYVTPLGKAVVNKKIARKLVSENKVFNMPVSYHDNDHNIEVQIPLIQYYYTDAPMIVPIIIGTNDINTLNDIVKALKPLFTKDNLFVISSDFSHYPSYENANKVDSLTAEAIITGIPDKFISVLQNNLLKGIPNLATGMCGWTSGLVLMKLAYGNHNLEFKKLTYCNSGDSHYSDKQNVVGYNAMALYETENVKTSSDLSFSKTEKDLLFKIAHESIEAVLRGKPAPKIDENKIPSALKKKNGAFVTLKLNGQLRGCIGKFVSDDPLYIAIQQSARSSAFDDPRFDRLTLPEYKNIDMEITVLGPLKQIADKSEIILGKHGIYIQKGHSAGTMLPQVATENGWDVEEFLSYTSQYKAGIGPDGWKTADLYIYEGLVLEEE